MPFPYVITAQSGARDLESWLAAHTGDVDELLAGPGAILLRGFEVASAEQFNALAAVVLGPLMRYIEGASPRLPVSGSVYTSTEYAPQLPIALHNELSYSHRWPARIAFFCREPAADGGQTPLADSRRVYQRIATHRPLPAAIEYRRVMPADKGFGIPWPTVFATDDRTQVETYCRAAGIDFAWLPADSLRTCQVRPTAVIHPATAAPVWFNQAHQWHPSNAGRQAEAELRDLFGSDLPMNAVLPGGGEIGADTLDAIRDAYREHTAVFDWQQGDVLVIDNMLTAHGRTPFTGSRQVLVAMGGPVSLTEVRAVTP